VSTFQKKNIDKPDDTRTFDKGHLDAVTLGEVAFGRAIFEPGWRWSESVKPIAGTDSCQVHHNGYIVSGSLHVVMDDGTEIDVNPGDVFVCPPGHDAWVTSDEPCVAYDFSPGAIATYAKPAG
jgi:mannose-6-phosphate isomerase-like protein (cupin superfamily)